MRATSTAAARVRTLTRASTCAATRRSSYDVLFVENVTDIDDKVILRAHVTRAEQVAAAVRRAHHAGLGDVPLASRLTHLRAFAHAGPRDRGAPARC